jgi:hypothetical protein
VERARSKGVEGVETSEQLDLQWDGAIVSDLRQFSEAAYKDAFLTLIGAGIIAVIAAFLTRETYCCQVAS